MSHREIQSADYSYWLLVKNWSAFEAAYLLLGIEPASLPLLDENRTEEEQDAKIRIDRLRRILDGAVSAGDFGKVVIADEGRTIAPPISASDWINWARRHNVEYSESLSVAAAEHIAKGHTDPAGIHPRTEATYQRIIGAMLELLVGETKGKPNSLFRNQEAIIQEIISRYGSRDGISERNLDAKFAAANRRLLED